jgi:hypothetical protein
MATETIGSICGTCLAHIAASHDPDLCFRCGARYDSGPHVLIRMDVTARYGRGSVDVTPRVELDWRGAWDIDKRALLAAEFDR